MTVESISLSAIPRPQNSLVGRLPEVAAIQRLLSEPKIRLLTLVGPGGIGKTRLALHAALTAEGFPDGRWFVELAGLTNPELILPQIAHAIGVRELAGASVLDGIDEALGGKRTLLVLDNFEHLLRGATAVSQLLAHMDGLVVLTTSRAPLHLTSEYVFPVGALGVDASAGLPHGDAVELFLQRSRSIRPGYQPAQTELDAIAQICTQLSGLPLAIELAAARTRVLSPQALLMRLQQPLELLTSGPQDAPERHRSMRSAIGWSYHLLSPTQQALIRVMGVFAGSAPLDGLEWVADAAGIAQSAEVIDLVTELKNASMLEIDERDPAEVRFQLFATVREFALDELDQHQETAWARDLHADWVDVLVASLEPASYSANEYRMHRRLRTELDNIRAALDWSIESGNIGRAARIAGNLWSFWSFGGQSNEGQRWMDRILPLADASGLAPEDERPLRMGAAMVAWSQGNADQSAREFERLLVLARELENPGWQADALMWRAQAAWYSGAYEAVTEYANATLEFQREAPVQVACAHTLLGVTAMRLDRLDEALPILERARTHQRQAGSSRALIWTLQQLADLRLLKGDAAGSAAAHQESIRLALANSDSWGIFEDLWGLMVIALQRGWVQEALELLAGAELMRTTHAVLPREGSLLTAEDRARLGEALAGDDLLRLAEEAAGRSVEELVERACAIAFALETESSQPRTVREPARQAPGRAFALSNREQDVLALMVRGMTDRQIGLELSISPKTARTHVAHVLHKLDARNRAVAVRKALEHELV